MGVIFSYPGNASRAVVYRQIQSVMSHPTLQRCSQGPLKTPIVLEAVLKIRCERCIYQDCWQCISPGEYGNWLQFVQIAMVKSSEMLFSFLIIYHIDLCMDVHFRLFLLCIFIRGVSENVLGKLLQFLYHPLLQDISKCHKNIHNITLTFQKGCLAKKTKAVSIKEHLGVHRLCLAGWNWFVVMNQACEIVAVRCWLRLWKAFRT